MEQLYKLKIREKNDNNYRSLLENGINPLLAKLLSSRGINDTLQIRYEWSNLINPNKLHQIEKSAKKLVDCIIDKKNILIVADYDCDGATSCALSLRFLKSVGANVNFIVPNRFINSYGLSVDIVKQAYEVCNGDIDLIITVDNGISSIDGVKFAKELGIEVIITDHHLPGKFLPDAYAIVNPNQRDCEFPSKNLAGVGVAFYLMIAVRSEMRNRGIYKNNAKTKLNELVDLVALGTVADLVKLDDNNRILVSKGLSIIRANKSIAGIRALFEVSRKNSANANSNDLGFSIAPKINAAGRLSDMTIGVRCLITDDYNEALDLAKKLNNINFERRNIEKETNLQALLEIENYNKDKKNSICIYKKEWNHGVVGLVASKLKDKFWKPTIAFAPSNGYDLRGSGRSIKGINIKNILEYISNNYSGLIKQFGGHAMAAGLTIRESDYNQFSNVFEEAITKEMDSEIIEPILETDGSLEMEFANVETSDLLNKQVWGSGFSEPIFLDNFKIISQKVINNEHLKLNVQRNGKTFEAIYFGHTEINYKNITAAYKIETNYWNNNKSLQLLIQLTIPFDGKTISQKNSL